MFIKFVIFRMDLTFIKKPWAKEVKPIEKELERISYFRRQSKKISERKCAVMLDGNTIELVNYSYGTKFKLTGLR